uniref:U3 small nucleolar RNA-associated protein 15 homolog n=3 Tax=Lygus hesperus TaxID=30085 RepID=A0A0A9Z7V6_LYGHE
MSHFKKTNAKIFAKSSAKVTQDTVYWKQLGVPVLLKEFGTINTIDFSPVEPYHFAVSCSARVQIYNPITKLVHKTLSKFKENAYGATFRSDGQLLCCGGDEMHVKLFDVASKGLLRVFKGHTRSVRRCFFTSNNSHIASFSDDKTVKVWDIAQETEVYSFNAHDDYVRAGAVSPVSPTTLLSGGYDKKIKMFDTRTSSEPIFTVDHGSPVECLIFLPSGGIFISGGGTELRVWDALCSGRLLARVSHHHKTITCLALGSNGSRLFSGSLDRHVKIYDISTYKVVHNIDYSNAILSIGVSADDGTLAVGTVDGIVSVKQRDVEQAKALKAPSKKGVSLSTRRFAGDKFQLVSHEEKQVTSKFDVCLRKFQYGKALEKVLMHFVTSKTPHVTVSILHELIRRKGLHNALLVNENKTTTALLRFLLRYLGDLRFCRILLDVFNVVIDVFEDRLGSCSPEVFELFKKLQQKVHEEVELTKDLLNLGGAISLLLSASVTSVEPSSAIVPPPIVPSITAQT